MGRYGISPFRNMKYTDHMPFIGNKDVKYKLVLPNNIEHMAWYSRDLLTLPVYYDNVECVVDHEKIAKRVPKNTIFGASLYFLVNDKLFFIHQTDCPINRWERWVPYESQFCTAFFILALRHSTNFIFENCSVPVFPLIDKFGTHVSPNYVEHCHASDIKKDLDIFFSGRCAIRPAREHAGRNILEAFPNSSIQFIDHGIAFDAPEYIDLMSRTKIAWCPRSVWSDPDRDCNCPTGRDYEAMCSEAMIIKHPIGIVESEKRIPGVHFVECKNDDTDLMEKLSYYLEHDEERKTIARNGRLWWERNGSARGRSVFMLKCCLQAMGEIEPFFDPINA